MEKIKSYFKKHKRQILIMTCMTLMMCLSFALSVSATGVEGGDLTNVGTVADFLWDQIGEVVTTIIGTPLLLIPIGIFVAGAAIGLAKRFIGR